jgi:hypothetical protein
MGIDNTKSKSKSVHANDEIVAIDSNGPQTLTAKSTSLETDEIPSGLLNNFIVPDYLAINDDNIITRTYNLVFNPATNEIDKIPIVSSEPLEIGFDQNRFIFYMFLRRQDMNGFNILNIGNADGSIKYVQIRMLEHWMYQVYDPINNDSIGKI